MKLILLGSGAVRPDLERWGPAQVVEVGGEQLLFDCGRGATMRMVEAGMDITALRRVFFTHQHYDHNCDFPYFFLTGWVLGRNAPVEIVGPRGTQAFCDGLFKHAYRDDIASRAGHPLYSEHGCEYIARDVTEDELTITGDGWRMTMVHVLHREPILDNLAFRIEADGRSLVVVGDAMQCDSLCDLAEGCDLLVHECTFPTERIEKAKWGSFHIPPRDLGRWARQRGVKRLLLKHFAVQEGVEVESMVEEVRNEFGDNGLIVGHDLMTVEV
jgi:ribonuclease Z